MKSWMFLPAALLAAVCGAQPVEREAPPDLPSNQAGGQLVDADPSVAQARHALAAARERSQALRAGPHEWTARGTVQRRHDRALGANSSEWTVSLERAIRIGGKAGIDRELGEATVRLAQARYGEARHEAAVALLGIWLDWSGADRAAVLWTQQLQSAQENLDAVSKRRKAGDASQLELNAVRADLAEVQRQHSAATTEQAKARARLMARFPALAPASIAPEAPQELGGSPGEWRERILLESDVLRAAREELRLAELLASRARADRVPDPTIGIYTNSERSGAERIVGLSLGMPIGGAARQAQERESLQQAEAARAQVEQIQRELEADIAQEMASAAGSLERWRLAAASQDIIRENARLTQRAYSLGEADLQTLLLARRQGVDAALGAEQARMDALRSRYRLLIDAHLIWGLQQD